ncbi:diguanylate cyclase [Falsirhodobacter sp. 20TX0035]|uniref:diguanylate cyclase n=1 Tax=Falsirhodobacter sp. 20TX0035 TaxID=3022019 RepID=UPI00232F7B02|nr:diguanylate cyclase [Falsirhodobacter sp. 20TX0035]MDB6452389.1 diguanylate cyclase [Falsirhodobacter sp. 20TX0035]
MTRHVLVIDVSHANRTTLKRRLATGCYTTSFAASAEEALIDARQTRPDVVLIDMPDAVALLQHLCRDLRLRDVPLLVLSDEQDRLPLIRAGATDVLTRPVDESVLLARLRAMLRQRAQNEEHTSTGLAEEGAGFEMPASVAFIADRTDGTARLRTDLVPYMSDRLLRLTREEALTGRTVPDLFVIEAGLGGSAAGLRLMSELRAQAETRNVPVCILDSDQDAQGVAMAWDLGADEVVPAQIGAPELALRLSILLRMKRRQDRRRASVAQGLRMAMVDPLTGLHNRRFAMPRLETMAHGDLAVLQIDLDWFKSVNDRYGHAAGDAVLRKVASRLTERLGPQDLAARIGGEEFLIALPDTQLAQAIGFADQLCQRMAADPVHLPSGEVVDVTISIGLATRRRMGGESMADTLDRADRALLQSKRDGRNRVTVASSPAEWTTARSA